MNIFKTRYLLAHLVIQSILMFGCMAIAIPIKFFRDSLPVRFGSICCRCILFDIFLGGMVWFVANIEAGLSVASFPRTWFWTLMDGARAAREQQQ
jgi:hypothetical protein